MTSTETGKELCIPLWCEIFDLMLWMSTSLSMQIILPKWASQSNIVKGSDMEILVESPIFPNCVCGILIWARGFSMEGIKMHVTCFQRKKMTGPIYHWFLYVTLHTMYWKGKTYVVLRSGCTSIAIRGKLGCWIYFQCYEYYDMLGC